MEKSKQAIEDGQLVEVIQSKTSTAREKQKAFDKLYLAHQRQLEIYFLKRLRDADDAEDLKMITFEKIHKNIDKYNSDEAAFSTWMYKIAVNTLIDFKRKDKFEVLSIEALSEKVAEKNYESEGIEFQINADAITPEEKMIRDQNVKTVRDAINSIENEKVRKLMQYRFIEELSFEEIAELEGVDKNNSTLRVNAMRGQNILREMLS